MLGADWVCGYAIIYSMDVKPLACLLGDLLMGVYTGPLRLRIDRPGQENWFTDGELIYYVGVSGLPIQIVVPHNFETDLASVPFLLRSLVLSNAKTAWAGVIHDRLYWRGTCSRKAADRVLFCALRDSGCTRFWSTVYYLAVRVGGWYPWYQRRKRHAKL